MVLLQWFNGKEWVDCGHYHTAEMAWICLGGDNLNYRVIDKAGTVLKENLAEQQASEVE
jgi:hypothetical protein